ncbi:MAG: BON domain-containing protein [Chloroflexota bacterium]|nr:BON domain-containing protein [Chloroflexota bacterium]
MAHGLRLADLAEYPYSMPAALACFPQDLVICDDAGDRERQRGAGSTLSPVGTVDSVLATSHGVRLVVERAFAPGTYVVVPGESVSAVRVDAEEPGAPGATAVRWVIARCRPEDLSARGVFSRVVGRLTPFPLAAPAPTPILDDRAAALQLEQVLRDDPFTAAGGLTVRVRYGVAILDGWLRLAVGKVQADRMARATPGVWQVRNRLISDEELRSLVQNVLHALPGASSQVTDVRLELGHVIVRLRPPLEASGEPPAGEAVRAATGAVAGVRSVELETELL